LFRTLLQVHLSGILTFSIALLHSQKKTINIMFGSKKKSLSPADCYLDDISSMADGTEASIPPPPPPLGDRAQSFVRTRPAAEGLPREAYLIEESDSIEAQDISYWPSAWDSYFQSGTGYVFCSRRRRSCAALGLSIGMSNNQGEDRSNSLSAIHNAPDTGSAPTPAPTVCENRIVTDNTCYAPYTMMNIAFNNCDALGDDWVGIYQSPVTELEDLGNPLMWLWTCNSQELDDCEGVGTFADELPFGGGLPAGNYEAHLVRRNSGGPYASYTGSPSFSVSDSC
jgi:hypothetical protein